VAAFRAVVIGVVLAVAVPATADDPCPSRIQDNGLRVPDWQCIARRPRERGDALARPRPARRPASRCPSIVAGDLRIPDWKCLAAPRRRE
jgi:hypothetical protein